MIVSAAPRCELPPEARHDAAGRVDDVAEPDRRVRGAVLAAGARDDQLSRCLGPPQDARGLDGLVRGEQYEALDAGAHRGGDDRRGAEHVRRHRLDRMLLEQRHVLVRGRVEDHVRPMPLEHVERARKAAHVGEHRHDLDSGIAQVGGEVDERRFRLLDEDEPRRAGAGDSPAELRADRPRRPRDEHRRAVEVRGRVRRPRGPHGTAEQELDAPVFRPRAIPSRRPPSYGRRARRSPAARLVLDGTFVQESSSCVKSQCNYSSIVSAKARPKPSVVTSPTSLPPCSKASGIIVSASIVRIAPPANASTNASAPGPAESNAA